MIAGGTYYVTETQPTFFSTIAPSMNPLTPGVITTFPGEDVTIAINSSTWAGFTIAGNHWRLRGNLGSRISLDICGCKDDAISYILTFAPLVRDVIIGDGVDFVVGCDIGAEVYTAAGLKLENVGEDIVFDGFRLIAEGNAKLLYGMVYQSVNDTEPPAVGPYRLQIINCEFRARAQVLITMVGGYFLIDTSHFETDATLFQGGFEFMTIQNSIFELSGNDTFTFDFVMFTPTDFVLQQNTFISTSSSHPLFIRLGDAQSVYILNNLFYGDWSRDYLMVGLMGCGYIQFDTDSVRGCNRFSDPAVQWTSCAPQLLWHNLSCPDAGVGLSIDFVGPMDYHTSPLYIGHSSYASASLDFDGTIRDDPPAMGAYDRVITCYGEVGREACHGHGSCVENDDCRCHSPDFYGDNCNITTCFDFESNETGVCSTHGSCVLPDRCLCDDLWSTRIVGCDDFSCEDGLWGVSDALIVCGGNGSCSHTDTTCVCNDNWENRDGSFCNDFRCEDNLYSIFEESSVCSGHGICLPSNSTCVCNDNWENRDGSFCNDFRCEDNEFYLDGVFEESVCSGHGFCLPYNSTCVCNDNWENRDGSFCNDFRCEDNLYGVFEESSVCSGHGSCLPSNPTCICDLNWIASADVVPSPCADYLCEDAVSLLHSPSEVCSGHGSCTFQDTACVCVEGFFHYGSGYCNRFPCEDGSMANDAMTCHGHGRCSMDDRSCQCEEHTGWFGIGCELCADHWSHSSNCSGCADGWKGDDCSANSSTGVISASWSLFGIVSLVVIVLVVAVVVLVYLFVRRNSAQSSGGGDQELDDISSPKSRDKSTDAPTKMEKLTASSRRFGAAANWMHVKDVLCSRSDTVGKDGQTTAILKLSLRSGSRQKSITDEDIQKAVDEHVGDDEDLAEIVIEVEEDL